MNKIRTLLFLFVFTIPALASAGKDDRPKVAYVPADSVSLEDVFFSRLLSDYLGEDSTMRAKTLKLTKKECKKLISEKESWKKEISEKLTLWGETSSMSANEVFYKSARMFLVDPIHENADVMERALYNGVLADLDSTNSENVRRSAAQAIYDLLGMTYATSGIDVYVNQYYRNRAYIHNDSVDMVILQNTSSPWKADVFMAMKFGAEKQHMRIHLRMPAWLHNEVMPGDRYRYGKIREFYQVYINGKLSLVRAENGYITIDRLWSSDDVVRMKFVTPVRRIYKNKGADKKCFALQRGPIVYAYSGKDKEKYFSVTEPIGDIYDIKVLHTNKLVTKMYGKSRKDAEKPVDCYLYPYYILKSLKGPEKHLWLQEVE